MIKTTNRPHSFHIPIMGPGFTIDTPLKVSKYGILSVVSLVDDILVDQVCKYHAGLVGIDYELIGNDDEDPRANRITRYLNLLNKLISDQVTDLKKQPFTPESDITRYFELLPEGETKTLYREALQEENPEKKTEIENRLRGLVVPGKIEVNIMTKLDTPTYHNGEKLPPQFSCAMSAFRGFAKSDLRGSVVFSAGINQQLYAYIPEFEDFYLDENGQFKKKIVLKVSDFRSAEIQGRFLAKRGVWVSEFRIESGLNCGGHAFPTNGSLLGPILDKFKNERHNLSLKLFDICNQTLAKAGRKEMESIPEVSLTVQGGIGTHLEDKMLMDYYQVDRTGWGTPFLLVPEVTCVDNKHLEKLKTATEEDVFLGTSSPLGIPFWNLRSSDSENNRRRLIEEGNPGSPCPKGFLKLNTEFGERAICRASNVYQKKKLESLENENYTDEQKEAIKEDVLSKSCICHDMGGAPKIKYEIDTSATPGYCVGPGIVNYSDVFTLEQMVDHIYGRSPLPMPKDRPHLFIRELMIYVGYLRDGMQRIPAVLTERQHEHIENFKSNLRDGIEYYRNHVDQIAPEDRKKFVTQLDEQLQEINLYDPIVS